MTLRAHLDQERHWYGEAVHYRTMRPRPNEDVWQVYGAGLRHVCECTDEHAAILVCEAINALLPKRAANAQCSQPGKPATE